MPPALHVFEYAVLRVVPRVERAEFLNVGVVVLCRALGALHVRFHLPEARLQAVFGELDLPDLTARLRAFEHICQGRAQGGFVGREGVGKSLEAHGEVGGVGVGEVHQALGQQLLQGGGLLAVGGHEVHGVGVLHKHAHGAQHVFFGAGQGLAEAALAFAGHHRAA